MKVYIYVLKHPETNEVRYVGLTRFPAKRLNNEINYPHTKHLRNWVNSLKSDSLKPVMEVVEETEEGLACAVEKKWIAEMRAKGCRLINYTDGGERGYTCTDEYRAAVSAALIGKSNGPLSAEHKAKISAAIKGKKHPWVSARLVEFNKSRAGIPLSDDRKRQLSEIAKKNGMTEEHRKKIGDASRRRKGTSRFTYEQRAEIKFLIQQGYSAGVIKETYKISAEMVSSVKKGESWDEVPPANSVAVLPPLKTLRIRNEKGQYGSSTVPKAAIQDQQ